MALFSFGYFRCIPLDSMLDSQRKDEIAEFKRLSEEDIAEMERMVPLEPLDAEW